VPSLNLKPNPGGGTAKKITSLPYKKFVKATQKNKIKQATKPKTSRLASFKKTEEKGLPGSNSV